jgi:preprotein translocase subunit SecF
MKSLDEEDHQRYLRTLESSFAAQAGMAGDIIEASPMPRATSTATSTPAAALSVGDTGVWSEKRFESIGPTIGLELRNKSLWAILIALCAIVLYITYSFRKVSRPVASWKYGVCAFIALVHDVSIPTGFMALMGHFYGWEADLLFVTALLTILGFSIHDTIVVYDRIRENLQRGAGKNFDDVANASVNQTMARSINTSLTTVIVLTALTLMGGETTKHFTIVLILGFFFGTYSSIFIASPLLVIWNKLTHH